MAVDLLDGQIATIQWVVDVRCIILDLQDRLMSVRIHTGRRDVAVRLRCSTWSTADRIEWHGDVDDRWQETVAGHQQLFGYTTQFFLLLNDELLQFFVFAL